MTAVKWLEVHIDTNHTGLEPVETMLSALGIDGVVIDDETEFEDFLENNRQYWDYVDEDLRQEMQGRSRITFYLEAGDEGFAKLGEVRIALEELKKTRDDCGTLLMTLDDLEDADWENNWKQYYKPMEIGDRLLVVPEWLREDPKVRAGLAAGRVALVLDPGLTFGTGSHATTRLCLTALEKTIRGGERVLDLGCGTGSLTGLLAEAGYDMIGIDNSGEMLQMAMDKRAASGQDILYLLQDMREFELYGTVRAVVSICDSMNYMMEYRDLVQVFRLVNNYLDPRGVFIFDLNTEYKYRELLADNTFAEAREESSFIWDNFYDESSGINEYDLTLFIREGQLYRKYEETHFQKAYSLDEVKRAALEAGMEFVAAYDACTRNPVREDSERIYVIMREQGKTMRDEE